MFRVVFIFVIGIILGPLALNAQAQLDTTITNRLDTTGISSLDTARIDSTLRNPKEPSSEDIREANAVFKDSARLAIEAKTRQAWRRSMFVPGWGQITNGGLWWIKVPVIYGGFVSTGLIFEFNNRHYQKVLKEVQYRSTNNHAIPPDSEYEYIGADPQGTEYLVSWKDYHRRMRDVSVLLTLGWYALNIIEAYVDSILKNRWEVGERLAIKVSPASTPLSHTVHSRPGSFGNPQTAWGFQVKFNIN